MTLNIGRASGDAPTDSIGTFVGACPDARPPLPYVPAGTPNAHRFRRHHSYECKALLTALGSFCMTRSRVRAAPVGARRPCSQFCNVLALTFRKSAIWDCDMPKSFRTLLISGGVKTCRRRGSGLSRISSRPSRSSSKRFLFFVMECSPSNFSRSRELSSSAPATQPWKGQSPLTFDTP